MASEGHGAAVQGPPGRRVHAHGAQQVLHEERGGARGARGQGVVVPSVHIQHEEVGQLVLVHMMEADMGGDEEAVRMWWKWLKERHGNGSCLQSVGEAVRRHLESLAFVLGGLGQCRHGQRRLEEQAQEAVGQVPLTRDVLDQTVLMNKEK